MIPNEILVIPNPNNKIEIRVGHPETRSPTTIFLVIKYADQINPKTKKEMPTKVTNRIGAKEKATNESMNNLIFLLKVHFDLPFFLACLSYPIVNWLYPKLSICKKIE